MAAVAWQGHLVKVCQIQFARTGYFVHFPYHPDSLGLMRRCEIAPGERTVDFNMAQQGYAMSRHVKFSHHVDGVDGNAVCTPVGRIG